MKTIKRKTLEKQIKDGRIEVMFEIGKHYVEVRKSNGKTETLQVI